MDDQTYFFNAFFDDGMDQYNAEEILTLSGHKLIKQVTKYNPNSRYTEVEIHRSDNEDEIAWHNHKGFTFGQDVLLSWLPDLRKSISDENSGELNQEYKRDIFDSLNEQSLRLFYRKIVNTMPPLLKDTTEVAILLSSYILKRGLTCILKHKGASILEAEAFLPFDLKVFSDTVFATSFVGEVSSKLESNRQLLQDYTSQVQIGKLPAELWSEYGDILWRTLFPEKVYLQFERAFGYAQAHRRGLRIRLTIEDPDMSIVPWEFARYEATGTFLAVSEHILMTRYLHLRSDKVHVKSGQKLKTILLLVSNPTDLSQIDTATEISQTEKVYSEMGVRVVRIQPATKMALWQAYSTSNFDGLHYIGHSTFEQQSAYLFLENEDGKSVKCTADQLSTLLHSNEPPGFVFLNSCSSAMSTNYHSFVGIAPHLIQTGVPVVVAMLFPIRDTSAAIFSREFYAFLQRGFPYEHAVHKGRQALFFTVGNTSADFVTPIIFMNH